MERAAVCCLYDAGSFGSRGRVDANDSAEAAHRCGAALGLKESGIKADHSRLISLSNLCRGVGGGGGAGEIFGNLQFQGS